MKKPIDLDSILSICWKLSIVVLIWEVALLYKINSNTLDRLNNVEAIMCSHKTELKLLCR